MKVLFDTNVLLDVLLDRTPHVESSARLFAYVESGKIEGVICATTVTTVHYLADKTIGPKLAKNAIQDLLSIFIIAPVNRLVLDRAMKMHKMADFEDAVICAAAQQVGCDGVLTRNLKDFRKAQIPIYSPEELAHILKVH